MYLFLGPFIEACSNICPKCRSNWCDSLFLKVRSPITVTGKAVAGNLPAPMNLHVITENIQATAPSSARGVTEHFPGLTTSPYTWRDTFEKDTRNFYLYSLERFSIWQHKGLSSTRGKDSTLKHYRKSQWSLPKKKKRREGRSKGMNNIKQMWTFLINKGNNDWI